ATEDAATCRPARPNGTAIFRQSLLDDPARAVVAGRVPGIAHARDLDHVARVRGVDELVVPDVDAHVAEPMEEDEVAGLELIAGDGDAVVEHRGRMVRKRHADLREDEHGEARAVEAAGRGAAP